MTQVDRRQIMSVAEFDAIPTGNNASDACQKYFNLLIADNKRLPYTVDRSEMTKGQQILQELWDLECEVRNGGISQYFWNCTHRIFDVADWLEELGLSELHADYSRELGALDQEEKWWMLKTKFVESKGKTDFASFQESVELLENSIAFDDVYYDTHQSALMTCLAEYVRNHRAEFITESADAHP